MEGRWEDPRWCKNLGGEKEEAGDGVLEVSAPRLPAGREGWGAPETEAGQHDHLVMAALFL